jgi:hypothetical protein
MTVPGDAITAELRTPQVGVGGLKRIDQILGDSLKVGIKIGHRAAAHMHSMTGRVMGTPSDEPERALQYPDQQ